MSVDPQAAQPRRIYAIGDIHGRLDLLERAIAAILRDVEQNGSAALTVTVGDYIDRGPASRGVIERLADDPFPTPLTALKGNHEDMLEAFLADPNGGAHWMENGGLATLRSYGVELQGDGRADFAAARDELRAAMPAAHFTRLPARPFSCRSAPAIISSVMPACDQASRSSASAKGSALDPPAIPRQRSGFRQDRRARPHARAGA